MYVDHIWKKRLKYFNSIKTFNSSLYKFILETAFLYGLDFKKSEQYLLNFERKKTFTDLDNNLTRVG